jgi:hypothetical protein
MLLIPIAATIASAATHYSGRDTGSGKAVVSRVGSRWQVDYRLPRNAEAWIFPVSAPTLADHKPWRVAAWQAETPGARIERRGAYDVLVPTRGRYVPRTVRVTFKPTSATLDREYDPAVVFSNGSVALYSDQFDLVPATNPDTVATKQDGLSVEDLGGKHLSVRFHDAAGPVFVSGRRQVDPVLEGAATYVVFGAGEVEQVGGVAMIADPALPVWLKTDIAAFAPQVATTYAARLGSRDDPSLPLLLMGWRGATPGKVVNDGGVRPGEILLNFAGDGLLDRNERAARRTRWFIAHEMAHFWLGTEGVAYRAPSDAWITEGGAEMMAFTLLAASNHDYAVGELQHAVDDCIKLAIRPIATATQRHESRAFYACGTVFALAGAGAIHKKGGADVFDFIRPLIARHRSDRLIGSADWLDHFVAVSSNAAAGDAIRLLLEQGSANPAQEITTILRSGNVPFSAIGGSVVLAPVAI